MTEITIDETKLKELLKVVITELLEEQKEKFSEFLLHEQKEDFSKFLAESLEDILIKNAIQEGENTETFSREQVLKILNKKP